MYARQIGGGPPVLLLHGQPGEGQDWDAVADRLRSSYHLIIPDRPGYGRSAGRALGLAGNAEEAHRLLGDSGSVPATVVGHSLGAAVALRLAQLHPDDVSALVLVAPAGNHASVNGLDRLLALPVAGSALSFGLIRGLGHVAGFAAGRFPGGGWARLGEIVGVSPERLEAHAREWRSGSLWRTFAVEQRALVAEMPALENGLPSVTASTVVLAGSQDRVIPPAAAAELARALPNADLQWVPGGGHLLPWQVPDMVADVVARVAGTGPDD